MSLLSVVEICALLETFRNIDLYHQGIYRVRVSARTANFIGFPYDISLKLSPKTGDPHCIHPARLISNIAESRAFLIRFCNEEVHLKESVYFQLKVPLNDPIVLKFELLYHDSNGNIKPESICEQNIGEAVFKTVSEFEIKLDFPSVFCYQFAPVIFSSDIALLSCTVHYVALGYTPNVLRSNAFGLLNIFKDRSGSARDYVGSSEIDKIYESYLKLLVKNFESLSDYYLQIVGKCINNEMRMSLEHRCFPSSLLLPGSNDPTLKNFSQRVASHCPEKVAAELINEMQAVGIQVSQLWRKTLELINKNTRQIMNVLKEQFNVEMRNHINESVIRKVLRTDNFVVALNKTCDVHHLIAEVRRKENGKSPRTLQKSTGLVIIEEMFLGEKDSSPKNFHFSNLFSRSRKKHSELHLMVLVHGYQGSPQDMQTLRNEISTVFPHTAFLISSSNENKTENSIEYLGNNLAFELKQFIADNKAAQIGNISFIGHSLGGLIIRAAIPLLTEYCSKFHLFMTLSSPHLGVKEASKLVRAGIWIVCNLNKATSLSELRLDDAKKVENSYLYKLSLSAGTELFTHLALVSSPQDRYSPYFSSRIEVIKNSINKHYKAYAAMAKNLLANRQKLYRIDADFKIQNSNFDSWIGRAGHIEFLENRQFMKFLLYMHPEFFE